MRVTHQPEALKAHINSAAVAIGNFDGVHLGHQALLHKFVKEATAEKLTPTVLTFFPHPVEVLNPSKKLERLTTTAEKLTLLESLGVECVLVAPFDQNLAMLSPEDFFNTYFLQNLKARRIHVGSGFRFGKNRIGNTDLLNTLCEKTNIALHVEPPFELSGERVSSSIIRTAIGMGEIKKASVLLGRPYFIAGPVLHGDKRGSKIGFPTANIHSSYEKVLPKAGVYITEVVWQKQCYLSVTNVGVRPTFYADSQTLMVETHILDFNARLYEEYLELRFLDRLRDEKKFDSIDSLKVQIQRDIETARASKKVAFV